MTTNGIGKMHEDVEVKCDFFSSSNSKCSLCPSFIFLFSHSARLCLSLWAPFSSRRLRLALVRMLDYTSLNRNTGTKIVGQHHNKLNSSLTVVVSARANAKAHHLC